MTSYKLAIAFVCFLAANGSGEKYRDTDLEARVDLLTSKIAEMEEENSLLRKSMSDSGDHLAFDCFRESSWSTIGIIPFDGCNGTKLGQPCLLKDFTDLLPSEPLTIIL